MIRSLFLHQLLLVLHSKIVGQLSTYLEKLSYQAFNGRRLWVGRHWRVSVINLRPKERPGQEGEAVETGISQEVTTEGKSRRRVSINLVKIFLMLLSCQLPSLIVEAKGEAG